MDERVTLNKKQLEIVDRIRCIFEELKKENIAFGLYVDGEGFHTLNFINMNDVKGIESIEEFIDWDDPRRECAYVDSEGRYIEPDDPEFNSQYIYYSPKKLLGMYIDMLEINECRDGYIANITDTD